jgi:fibrillarin-like pre-rRNA processing protein
MIWIDGVLVSPGPGGVYGERMLHGYRVWDPYRSKIAALYHMGGGVDLTVDMRVLYLGAANGTTVSHIADYTGVVYAVEFAARPMRDLLEIARKRENIVPIMADARTPEEYAPFVEPVDLLYMDVAQPDQAAIALRNSGFLKTGGWFILMLKTRSIDTTKAPEEIRNVVIGELKSAYDIAHDPIWLAPYHTDHVAIIGTKV